VITINGKKYLTYEEAADFATIMDDFRVRLHGLLRQIKEPCGALQEIAAIVADDRRWRLPWERSPAPAKRRAK
jgi:butyrate kinase